MKIKGIILITLMMTIPALAHADAEIHDPFYAPDARHLMSSTFVDYSNMRIAGEKTKKYNVFEEISYSIDGWWYAIADFSNGWIEPDGTDKYQERYWKAGVSRFISTSENSDILVNAYYTEYRPEHGDRYNTIQLQLCLDLMLDRTVKPFASVNYDRGVRQISKSDDSYEFYAGAWSKFGRLMIKGQSYTKYSHEAYTDSYLGLEAAYKISDNFAAGIYGQGLVYSHYDGGTDISSDLKGGVYIKILM